RDERAGQRQRRGPRRAAGMVAGAPPRQRRRPQKRIARVPVDEETVAAEAKRRDNERERGERTIAARLVCGLPRGPCERRPHQNARDARRRRDRAADARRRPPSRSEAMEREHREQEKRALGVDGAEEKRERKNRREERGALSVRQ